MGRWPAMLLLGAAACTATKDCTSVGCANGVVVRGPVGVIEPSRGTLTVCVEDVCQETRFEAGPGIDIAQVHFPEMGDGDDVTAVLVMPDGARYEDAIEATGTRPNGPGCGPVCIDAELTLA